MVSREWGRGLERGLNHSLEAIENRLASPTCALIKGALGPGCVVFLVELSECRGAPHRNADGVTEHGVEGFDPAHLAREHCAKVAGDRFSDRVEIQRMP